MSAAPVTCPACGVAAATGAAACLGCGTPLQVAVLRLLGRDEPPHRLLARDYTLGRAVENDISILNTSVSRRHARLAWTGSGFEVVDLGSRLGVFVDDVQVTRAAVPPGATLRLGEVQARLEPLERPSSGQVSAPTLAGQALAAERGGELLLSVLDALQPSLVLDDVLGRVLDAMLEIGGAERGFVLLEDPASGEAHGLKVRAARARRNASADPAGLPQALIARVRSTGESVFDDGPAGPAPGAGEEAVVPGRLTMACLPLLSPRTKGTAGERVRGVVYLDSTAVSGGFAPERERAMETLARHAGLALEIARLFEHEEERIRELQAARDREVEAGRAKDTFLANMTHELHTPLNAIINYAEMVHERAAEIGEKDLAADAERIRSSGRHLRRIVDDVLDLTRLQDGALALKPEAVDLAWLVSDVVEKARPLAARNGNAVELRVRDELGDAVLDSRRVRQALANLMDNAAKFTQRGTVVLEAWRDPGGWLHFEVADTGIGMSSEQMARVFEPFSQADGSVTRRFEGTGLGLALSRRICHAMGGELAAESQLGVGSRFLIRLPARPPAH